MMSISGGAQTATRTRWGRATRMPAFHCSMPAMSMYMSAAAAASTIIVKTDVVTSVSLFLWLLLVLALLVDLVVLISLVLTRLTGLVGLVSLVGRMIERAANTIQGV